MEKLNIVVLGRDYAAPFSAYILPAARERIKTEEDLLILGAFVGKSSVGALVASEQESVMDILSLYVDEKIRRSGIGSLLLESACDIYRQIGRQVDLICTEYNAEGNQATELQGFLESMGFEVNVSGDPLWSIGSEKLHHVPVIGAAFSPEFRKEPQIHYYSELTGEQLEELEADPDVPGYLKPSGMRRKILRQPSTVWIEDGKVLGWVIACESFDGGAILAAACKRKGAPDGCFRKLVTAAANRWYMMLGHDFPIYICTINEHATGLVKKLTLGQAKEYQMYTAKTGDPAPDWLLEINGGSGE